MMKAFLCHSCRSPGLKAALLCLLLALVTLAAWRKSSSNSSKPPSSDIVKAPDPGKGKQAQRHRGGRPGYSLHDRPPFDADQVSAPEVQELTA